MWTTKVLSLYLLSAPFVPSADDQFRSANHAVEGSRDICDGAVPQGMAAY